MLRLRDAQPFRLIPHSRGRHQFGGKAIHSGVIPNGTNVPLQLVLLLDLAEPNCPIEAKLPIKFLPFYYPFKYGTGGSTVQYTCRSDSEIHISYLSDTVPDDVFSEYLQVAELPCQKLELLPLSYEQARILAFLASDGFFPGYPRGQDYFKPSSDDLAVIKELDLKNLIRVGNQCARIPNMGDIICHNPECEFFDRRVHFLPLATVPPIPVNESDEFWHEFQGYVLFCFGLCYYCRTIIAFNVAS